MVKIAIAGGAGNVASEIVDVLVAQKKHDILILTRKDVSGPNPDARGITWVQADYSSTESLTSTLQGVNTVLSFVTEQEGQDSPIQRRLIDASINAGVKRFAPSEWACKDLEHLPWYAYKGDIRQYLKEVNREKKVLEYTLFQPGIFTNYLTKPYKTTKHITPLDVPIDFEKRRAILVEGGDDGIMTLTTAQDLAAVVARAIDYEGEWPEAGGIRGTDMKVGDLIALGEKIRGAKFKITRIPRNTLEDLSWESTWVPVVEHPSIPPDVAAGMGKFMTTRLMDAFSSGDHHVGDDWNKLLPDFEFTQAEPFLSEAWKGKP